MERGRMDAVKFWQNGVNNKEDCKKVSEVGKYNNSGGCLVSGDKTCL